MEAMVHRAKYAFSCENCFFQLTILEDSDNLARDHYLVTLERFYCVVYLYTILKRLNDSSFKLSNTNKTDIQILIFLKKIAWYVEHYSGKI